MKPDISELDTSLESGLGKHLEFYLILGLLVFNAALGFFQEARANAALEALRRRLSVNARVRRDGRWLVVPARELGPRGCRPAAGGRLPAGRRQDSGGRHGGGPVIPHRRVPGCRREGE